MEAILLIEAVERSMRSRKPHTLVRSHPPSFPEGISGNHLSDTLVWFSSKVANHMAKYGDP